MAPTSTISVGEVRKPPHITESHSVAKARQQKVKLTTPIASRYVFIAFDRTRQTLNKYETKKLTVQQLLIITGCLSRSSYDVVISFPIQYISPLGFDISNSKSQSLFTV